VHAVLVNPVYKGTLVWGSRGDYHPQAQLEPIRVDAAIPQMVDQATFGRVQGLLKARGPAEIPPRRVSSPYLLSGVLHCGGCGARMFGQGAKSGR
jgi:hypothetical protein